MKCVCSDCVNDMALKAIIDGEGVNWATCAYCPSGKWGVPIDEVTNRINEVIRNFYTEVNLDPGWDAQYGYGSGRKLDDLLGDWLNQDHGNLLPDVRASLADRWRDPSGFDSTYREDPHFARLPRGRTGSMLAEWCKMLSKAAMETRYFNPEVKSHLDKVFSAILDDQTVDKSGLITTVGPGHAITYVYRARVFEDAEQVSGALAHPERELGPPPLGEASAGRMNAKGLSMFYGASSEAVALAEVRPPVGSYVLVGKFHFFRELRLLDFCKFKHVDLPKSFSMFSAFASIESQRHSFLAGMEDLIAQPVMPNNVDRSYLATQLVSDYLAASEPLNIDGIRFKSAQFGGSDDDYNVVLFVKSSVVAYANNTSKLKPSGGWVSFWFEKEGDDEEFRPDISCERSAYPPSESVAVTKHTGSVRKVSLFLDRDNVSIKTVKAVEIRCDSIQVRSNYLDGKPS